MYFLFRLFPNKVFKKQLAYTFSKMFNFLVSIKELTVEQIESVNPLDSDSEENANNYLHGGQGGEIPKEQQIIKISKLIEIYQQFFSTDILGYFLESPYLNHVNECLENLITLI